MRFQAAVVGFDSQPVSENTVVKRYITAAAKNTCFVFRTAGFISWDMTVPCPAAPRRRNVRRTFSFRHNRQRHIRQFVQKHLKLSAVRVNAGSTPALAWGGPTNCGALRDPAESRCSILILRGFFHGKAPQRDREGRSAKADFGMASRKESRERNLTKRKTEEAANRKIIYSPK